MTPPASDDRDEPAAFPAEGPESLPADTETLAVEAAAARDRSAAARKVRSFPTTPGVYLMKDAAGRVIYVSARPRTSGPGPAPTSSRPPPRIAAPPT